MVSCGRYFAVSDHRGPTFWSRLKCGAAKPSESRRNFADRLSGRRSVYVHVSSARTRLANRPRRRSHFDSGDGAQVRAYLTPVNERLGGSFPDWFELTSNVPPNKSPPNRHPQWPRARWIIRNIASENDGGAGAHQGSIALRVTSVERRGPAQQRPGSGDSSWAPMELPRERGTIGATRQRGAPFSLVVADVHTGRAAQVQVTPAAAASPTAESPTRQPAPTARVSLGVSAESVSLGTRTALKVTRVEPAVRRESGLEPGDVIVEADGHRSLARTAGECRAQEWPYAELTVRDSRTGRIHP